MLGQSLTQGNLPGQTLSVDADGYTDRWLYSDDINLTKTIKHRQLMQIVTIIAMHTIYSYRESGHDSVKDTVL